MFHSKIKQQMKIVTTFFLLLFSTLLHAQNFAVTLGKGADCTGFNICKIEAGEKVADNQITTQITTKGKKLKMAFLKNLAISKKF